MTREKALAGASVLLLAVLILAGCGTGIGNATPVQAARTTVQAMISGNEQALKEIDRSNTLDYPPQWLLEIATKQHFDTASANDFTFTPVGSDSVKVVNGRIDYDDTWQFVHENGGWYFFTMSLY